MNDYNDESDRNCTYLRLIGRSPGGEDDELANKLLMETPRQFGGDSDSLPGAGGANTDHVIVVGYLVT